MTTTRTKSTTQTSTLTKVVYVSRKVQADFLAILDTYGYFPEDYAKRLINDVRVFLDEEVIDRVKFVWTQPNSDYVLEELEYIVFVAGVGLADDPSGGIRYQLELANASFHVRVTHNERWKSMSEMEKDEIREDLQLKWSSAGQLNYSGGNWINDRTYSKDNYGLSRKHFTR
ncbi:MULTISPECIES: hypothetical protein [unclassified Nostoc]|uniref:HORMA-1 domain-containing protein n=1 Tax=unclassified Nostoc TaxID=2593658 RepID=UPI000CF3473E|nr:MULTISPECIES: hypothetical protein [unclassified Nostoc]AVH68379.1 hypothetical protein NPM_20094 [Nostoc sp. 'Peltigera membranacea cyanobiont' N6]MEA5623902.1 hypothetical protein [Nostoc sp. UHCC 0251]